VPCSAAGSSSGASASAAAPGGRGLHGERQRLHAVGRRDEAELRAVLLAVEVRLPHPELGRAVAAEPQQGAVQRGVRPDHAEVLAEAVHKRQLAQRARVAAPLRSTPPSSRTAIASRRRRRRRAVVRSRHHLAGQGRAPSESPAAYCTVPLLASRLSSSRSSCPPPPPPPPSAPARAAMALIAAIAVPSSRRGP